LRNPSNSQLARAAGLGTAAVPSKTFDVAVVGAGPADLAASVYEASVLGHQTELRTSGKSS